MQTKNKKIKMERRCFFSLFLSLLVFSSCILMVYAEILSDSYSYLNQDLFGSLSRVHPSTENSRYSSQGQAFEGDGNKILACKFYLSRIGVPSGYYHAVVYASTGTYGTNARPTGVYLANSTAYVISVTDSYALYMFNFTGANQITLVNGTTYCIALEVINATSLDDSNRVYVGRDGSSPTHAGNTFFYAPEVGGWFGTNSYDTCFYVYTDGSLPVAESVSLTLDSPADDSSVSEWFVNFTYVPVLAGSGKFYNSSLYLNNSLVVSNSSAIVNNTVNGLGYTFSSSGTYLWDIQVWNSTMGVFSSDGNFTIYVAGAYAFDLGETANATANLYIQKDLYRSSIETITVTSSTYTKKTLTKINGESISVTTTLESQKGITAFLAEFSEIIVTSAILLTQKSLFRPFSETTIITSLLSFSKHIYTTLATLIETLLISSSLETVYPHSYSANMEIFGLAALAFIFAVAAVGLAIFWKQNLTESK